MVDDFISFEFDVESDLNELVERGVRAVSRTTELLAGELVQTHIPAEAPRGATGALASDWHIRDVDPITKIVFPGGEAFYAHIVAHGRIGFGPRSGRALRVGDRFAARVGGAAPNPFHERAMSAVEGRADELLGEALAEGG